MIRPRIPIVVGTEALRPFASIWRAAAPLVAQVVVPALFVAGLAAPLGAAGGWIVLAAVLVGARLRRAEVESWALFLPGGLPGRVRQAFGPVAGLAAMAAALFERLTFVALAAVVASHYAVSFAIAVLRRTSLSGQVAAEDMAAPVAVLLVGVAWIGARGGRVWSERTQARWVWSSITVLAAIAIASGVALLAAARLERHRLERGRLAGASGSRRLRRPGCRSGPPRCSAP